jgi:putrescine aminotransferase
MQRSQVLPSDLIKLEQVSGLGIQEVWKLYRDHINPYQVELLGSFRPGRELVDFSEGCYIHLVDGTKILDLTGGIGVLNHGHNHPRILKARREFAERKAMEVHKSYLSPYVAALAHNIASLLPGDLKVSYFPNSGAESVEGALKLAFKAAKGTRSKILHADISFHGKLWAAGAITGSIENHYKFPSPVQSRVFEYNNIESLRKTISESLVRDGESDIFALVVEPMNASSMTIASKEFLLACRELCDFYGIFLIFDEVYTGWGKTGYLFNFMRVDDLVPDILCYAKSLGGGKASIAGYTSRTEVALKAYGTLRDATLHSTTYFGFGEEAITAIESINVLVEEKLVENSFKIGSLFETKMQGLISSLDNRFTIVGSGALWGITPKEKGLVNLAQIAGNLLGFSNGDSRFGAKVFGGALVSSLYNRHGILSYIGFNRSNPLVISFPLVAGVKEIDAAVMALDDILTESPLQLLKEFLLSRSDGPKAY